MTTRERILGFGGAALLIIAGAAAAVVLGGGTGQIVAMVLIGVGLVAVVSLIFFEVGLSEDAERARERRPPPTLPPSRARTIRVPRGGRMKPALERSRGQRRRLDRDGH